MSTTSDIKVAIFFAVIESVLLESENTDILFRQESRIFSLKGYFLTCIIN